MRKEGAISRRPLKRESEKARKDLRESAEQLKDEFPSI
jgi:hypothetical protein